MNEDEAYQAMFIFLERIYERGDVELSIVLSWMNREVWQDNSTADPAYWHDWIDAIKSIGK
ncbi:MAG TPA: hypothetical protein VHM26_06525 [Chitinophagaceae bacterium]|nr:hypothetical protein [Chitinophagaceae bacterium]